MPDALRSLADTVPAALVILLALGLTAWIAGRALDILDRTVNRKDDDE